MMFGRRIKLFRLFGFAVYIDFSWFFLAVIVAWSLATGIFPSWYGELSKAAYWWMGVAGAAGLFLSIVLHELSHSLIARRHGVVMKGITLFIFGGVAEMADEPPSPMAEFQVAIAGPIASVIVALTCAQLNILGRTLLWPDPLTGVLRYLAMINGILVAFNMVPAFPLDGGRVLRSILWRWKQSLSWATRITSRIGMGFAFILIGLGVLSAVTGNLIGGIWYFLIGMFLRGAANMSYQQLLIRKALEGDKVRRFMKPNPVSVPSRLTIADLVEDYIFKYHFKMYPVVDDDRLIGCITTRQVKEIPRERWHQTTVGEVAELCSPMNSIGPDTDAMQALSKMNQAHFSRLMVVEGGQLVGVITLKDMLDFLSMKVELEG
jgi:Zn-dependent protease